MSKRRLTVSITEPTRAQLQAENERLREVEIALQRLVRALEARRGSSHHMGRMAFEWDDDTADEVLAAHRAADEALGRLTRSR